MNYLVPFVGYLLMVLVYVYYLIKNMSSENMGMIFGNVLVLVGYALIAYKYYSKSSEKHEKEKDEESEKEHKPKYKINWGHLVLFIYFGLSAVLPITQFHLYDYLAIIGNMLLIVEDQGMISKIGYVATILFYFFSANHYMHEIEHHELKVKLLGALIIAIYYVIHLISKF